MSHQFSVHHLGRRQIAANVHNQALFRLLSGYDGLAGDENLAQRASVQAFATRIPDTSGEWDRRHPVMQ
jgi:hypothetical protein